MSDFQGRVAIVSGASSGIGEATAMRLGRDAADLVLLASPGDREDLSRVENQLHAMGARVVTLAADALPSDITIGDDAESNRWRTEYLYSRAASIYGGSAEIQRNIIARRLLDLGDDR